MPRRASQARSTARTASPALAWSLVAAVAVPAALAACGAPGPGPHGEGARVGGGEAPRATPGGATGGRPAVGPSSTAAAGTAPAASTLAASGAPALVAMPVPTASKMAEDLSRLGLDPLHLPPLNKLSPDTLRKVMPSFARSLGVKCDACHAPDDFKASTPAKKAAAGMWQRYVVELAFEDGSPLYCDSCHGGRRTFLDRHDAKALGAWMDASYVAKLRRADTQPIACETCHGDPFAARFLAGWQSRR